MQFDADLLLKDYAVPGIDICSSSTLRTKTSFFMEARGLLLYMWSSFQKIVENIV